jgi:hypothetical protein
LPPPGGIFLRQKNGSIERGIVPNRPADGGNGGPLRFVVIVVGDKKSSLRSFEHLELNTPGEARLAPARMAGLLIFPP